MGRPHLVLTTILTTMPTILSGLIRVVPSNFQAKNASLNNYRTLPNGFLNMEIMLSHLGVGMAYDALDGLDVHFVAA